MEDGIEQNMSTFLQNDLYESPIKDSTNNMDDEYLSKDWVIEYPPYFCKSPLDATNPRSKELKKEKKLIWKQIGKNMKEKNINSDEIQWMTFTTTFAVKKEFLKENKGFDMNGCFQFLLEQYLDQDGVCSVFKECNLQSIDGFTYDNWWAEPEMNEQQKKQLKESTIDLYNVDVDSSVEE